MLVKCPKCYKAVSSFSEKCQCGYDVKSYFINRYKNDMKSELKKLDAYKPPTEMEKPNLLKNLIPFGIALTICAIFLILAFQSADNKNVSYIFTVLTAVFIVLGIPISLWIAWIVYSKDLSEYKNWKKQTSDLCTYKNAQKAEICQKYNDILNTYLSPEISNKRCEEESHEIFVRGLYKSSAILLQCNKCGSINIVHLKDSEKMLDFEIDQDSLFVLRPRTNELKWLCKDCGYKF